MAIADRTVNGESKDLHDSLVAGLTSHGGEFRATLVRLTRHQATFEIYSPQCTLRVSEVLNEFRILLRDRTLWEETTLAEEPTEDSTYREMRAEMQGAN